MDRAEAEAERELCGLVNQLSWRLDAHVRGRTPDGLSVMQTVALRELTGPMSLRQLAERLCCEPPNATYVVDKLEAAGLVRRSPHPQDRRVKQVDLTREGHRVRREVLRRLGEQSPLGHLSAHEMTQLREVLLRALALPSAGDGT